MAHTKSDLLNTRVPKHAHQPKIGRDGATVCGDVATLHHSDDREHIGEHNSDYARSIARGTGKPKSGLVGVHGGMYHRDADGNRFQSITSTSVALARADAPLLETNPLAKPPEGKRLTPPQVHPSMEAHVELGRRLLAGVKPPRDFQTLQDQRRKK